MGLRLSKKHVVPSTIGFSILGGAALLFMGQHPGPTNCYMVTMPPVQYDHRPTRPFRRLAVSHQIVDATCRQYADFSYLNARLQSCVITNGDSAMMIVPNDMDPLYTACLVRHENGHLNGWPADHPGARYYSAPSPDRGQDTRPLYGF